MNSTKSSRNFPDLRVFLLYFQLQDAYVQLNDETSELRKLHQQLKQKELKATSLVTELTSVYYDIWPDSNPFKCAHCTT